MSFSVTFVGYTKTCPPAKHSVQMLLTNYKPETYGRAVHAMKISDQMCLVLRATADGTFDVPDLPKWASVRTHTYTGTGGVFLEIVVDGNGLPLFTKTTVIGSIYA